MQVTLITTSSLRQMILPSQKIGKYLLLTDEFTEREALTIEGDGEFWYLKLQSSLCFIDTKLHLKNSICLTELRLFEMLNNQKELIHLLVEPLAIDRLSFKKYRVRYGAELQIGRESGNQIKIDYPFISKKHALLSFTKSGWLFEDCASLNGSYINGERVVAGIQHSLTLGDIIFIMGFKLIIGPDFISFNSADQLVTLKTDDLCAYELQQEIVSSGNFSLQIRTGYFYPQSKFCHSICRLELSIDAPPPIPQSNEQPLLFLICPALTMVFASTSTGLLTIGQSIQNGDLRSSLPILIMSISMLLGSLLWPLMAQKYRQGLIKKQVTLRKNQYHNYLDQVIKDIELAREQQKIALQHNYQSLAQLRQNWLDCPTDLWGKQIQQPDFLKVRVGIGNLPMALKLTSPALKAQLDTDNLEEAMFQLITDNYQLKQVPVTISLTDNCLTGVVGEKTLCSNFVMSLIYQLALNYRYDELKMIFIYESSDYNFVRWLPHVWSTAGDFRFLATDKTTLKTLSHRLEQLIAQLTHPEGSHSDQFQLPHYLIFILNDQLMLPETLMNQLIHQPIARYFSILHFSEYQNKLSRYCRQILKIKADGGEIWAPAQSNQAIQKFDVDYLPTDWQCRQLAVTLLNLHLKIEQNQELLPQRLTFLALFKVAKVEHLNILERWQNHALSHSIATPIGINFQGQPLMLDLHDKADGPHGLIAGMTGSGKSELIITYILSLAVNYHPNQIAFVLIDYKGGGLAKAFQDLPHTAGIITNLDGAMIYRAMASIESELRRRQEIFNQISQAMGISNLDIDYYQSLFRNQKVSEPLPHLLIISDEFAELKAQQPEFMKNLISTARIGRSLGIHLILATQKPSGVVDEQIWSNSRFRIALKVQERADSMEMLRRVEAAELTVSGRFYLQVGYNERFELSQSAWSGAKYKVNASEITAIEKKITAINQNGQTIAEWSLAAADNQTEVAHVKQLDAIKAHLIWLAKTEKIVSCSLWLPELNPILIHDELLLLRSKKPFTGALQILIGLYDDPKRQAQEILTLTMDSTGHIAILGSVGSGKAMLIQTIIYDLAVSTTPSNLKLYIIDFADEILPDFKLLPHISEILYAFEGEKIIQLFKLLLDELNMRKHKMLGRGVSYQTFQENEAIRLPDIVLIIHHFAQLYEQAYITENELLSLLREGAKYGIYLVVSGLCLMDIRYSWQQYFPKYIVLQMNETSEYTTIFGKTDGLIPAKYLGRGLIKLDEVYEFQTASIAQTAIEGIVRIKKMINSQRKK